MLLLVGLGLGTKDLSVRALEEIRKPGVLFLETYTAFITKDYLSFIKKEAGRDIEVIGRPDLEDRVKGMVSRAKRQRVVILVIGDPLIATTHSIILNEAKRQKVKCEVLHSTSVFSVAIGESGLDVYRFGPTITIPFWFKNYKPTSFLKALEKNIKNNQHSLLLLDIDQKNRRPMSIGEAVNILDSAELVEKTGIFSDKFRMMILADLGRKTQLIRCVGIDEVSKKLEDEVEGKVLSIVVPTNPTFAEKESMDRIIG
jgi:diphthine synthase